MTASVLLCENYGFCGEYYACGHGKPVTLQENRNLCEAAQESLDVAGVVESAIEAAVEFARNPPEPALEDWELEIYAH